MWLLRWTASFQVLELHVWMNMLSYLSCMEWPLIMASSDCAYAIMDDISIRNLPTPKMNYKFYFGLKNLQLRAIWISRRIIKAKSQLHFSSLACKAWFWNAKTHNPEAKLLKSIQTLVFSVQGMHTHNSSQATISMPSQCTLSSCPQPRPSLLVQVKEITNTYLPPGFFAQAGSLFSRASSH